MNGSAVNSTLCWNLLITLCNQAITDSHTLAITCYSHCSTSGTLPENLPQGGIGTAMPYHTITQSITWAFTYRYRGRNDSAWVYEQFATQIRVSLITGLDWNPKICFYAQSYDIRVWLTSTLASTALIACIRAEELVLQHLLPLSCWVLTNNRLRQQQRGHRLQQVESEI